MEQHQVVVVCGDTGSGKTTQLPKIALEMGRGREGLRIGCTQPRRIAATSVAKRVAEEMGVGLGEEVGYQIRFEDRTTRDKTVVKFMTDGILLAETRGDGALKQYDTLIIDEAHERSLNIDFILGYLHRLLPRRPDLKIVISSATLDAATFAAFFQDVAVVEVEGRAFPVEDVYQAPMDSREHLAEQVARAAESLAELDPLGDTLVFLPGEREIRECADLLEGRRYPNTVVMPLFARLEGSAQQAVFKPMPHARRIILATNVAETSLTIPDIRSVIDSGIARVNRFDPRSGIQRLQIEPVSKASARQRRGRCGRVSEGICVRLYDEEEFEDRPDFTDPEILRSNLAGVVLQMEHLGLGDPLEFPFVDKPQPKRIMQAYNTLEEIGALWKKGKRVGLTDIGRTLARLPVDPRIGRMLIAAETEGCLREGLVIASALAVQDPRERPQEKQTQADQAHAKFRDKRSDFTGWLRWWHAVGAARRSSNNSLRRFCRENFVNYRRLQEWVNLHRELRSHLKALRWSVPDTKKRLSDPQDAYCEPLHRAILAGIPSQIGVQGGKGKGYKGASHTNFFLFPGSGVFKSQPAWVMAFEMVETAKLYAREVAMFDPAWVEKVAPHVCRYRYSNPHWVPEMGGVYGEESVLAFGLEVVGKRRVHYGRIDPEVARKIFILEALVNGETRAPMPVLAKNVATVKAAERMEHQLRRFGGLVHPEYVVDFYEARLPADICTQKAFEKWATKQLPGALDLKLEDCVVPLSEPFVPEDYPDRIPSSDGKAMFEVRYLHNPSEPGDGMTVLIPLGDLPHLPEWFGDWLVPGWLPEKVAALFRLLDKDLRRLLPSNREVVEHFLASRESHVPRCALVEAALDFLQSAFGVTVSATSFDLARMPAHLVMRFEVIGREGRVLGAGKDLAALRENLAVAVQVRFAEVKREVGFERTGLRRWDFGDLPESVPLERRTVGYPGLDSTCSLRLWPSAECAQGQHRLGVAALFRVAEKARVGELEKRLFAGGRRMVPETKPREEKKIEGGFGSLASAFGGTPTLVFKPDAVRDTGRKERRAHGLSDPEILLLGQMGVEPRRNREDLVTLVLMEGLGAPRKAAEWEAAVGRADWLEITGRLCEQLVPLLAVAKRIGGLLDRRESGYEESLEDMRVYFDQLLMPGWLLRGGLSQRLLELRGLELRLTRMFGSAPVKDLAKLERFLDASAGIWAEDGTCECGECPLPARYEEQLLKEGDLRLLVFAQELGNPRRKLR